MTEARDAPDLPNTHARAWSLARALLLALIAFVWIANSSGVISSNDGSHLALARALALRGETSIDPDRALTLEVDLAERAGRAYSDRPPGTAFAALPAVWLGDRLDPVMLERAKAQARAGRDVAPLPGARPYIETYAARAAAGSPGPRLAELIGSSIAISIHAALVGLLGLVLVDRLLLRLGVVDASARLFALASLALATAWGPYATALFSHVSAATAVSGFLLGIVELARREHGKEPVEPVNGLAALTGLAGAWAVACDYLLLLAIVPATALAIPWRRWGAVALGAAPILLAIAAYHTVAFGGPLAIGYDHQSNFAFARERGTTFSGDPLAGLWTLWGLGRGAGLLAQAPIVLVGLAALVGLGLERRRRTPAPISDPLPKPVPDPLPKPVPDPLPGPVPGPVPDPLPGPVPAPLLRALLGFCPWALALAFHRTPWGGGTGDHRYLIPLLSFAAVGLALLWARLKPAWRGVLAAAALASAWLVWRHFLAWHEAPPFDRTGLAALVAAPILIAGLARTWRQARKHAD